MKKHIGVVHEGKKLFKCHTCDYGAFGKKNLKRHIETLHEEKKPIAVKHEI